jgi:hypothetical protein
MAVKFEIFITLLLITFVLLGEKCGYKVWGLTRDSSCDLLI